jgi:carbon monoxide dehydrogenase subunit G
MELDHEFTVPVPVDQAWSVLLDVERVALCMPGATLDSVDGEEYAGRLKVKLGAMTITYRGTAKIVEADEAARALTIEGSGKEARGSGTASATVRARMSEQDGGTRVAVHTKLNVTGRPAQFGRNILAEVGAKLIARFAKALAEELEAAPAPAATEQSAAGETPASSKAETTPEAVPAATGAPETAEEPQAEVLEPESAPQAEAPQTKADQPVAAATPAESTEPTTSQAPQEAVDRQAAEDAARPAETRRRKRREDDAIDILEVAGPSVVKRTAPALGALVALLLGVRYLFRRRRGRHHR